MSDIVIYIPDDEPERFSLAQQAMVELLEILRDDPVLTSCVMTDALAWSLNQTYHKSYIKDLKELERLSEKALDL